jgi:hypothetical protein
LDHQTNHTACFNAQGLLYECIFDAFLFSPSLRPIRRLLLLGRRSTSLLSGYYKQVGVRHGYPWVPTDQTHGRPRQVGPAYQKTRRPVSGPNRPSWQPARPPEDFPEDSPYDLIQHDLKT